jgi:hypothetical protein
MLTVAGEIASTVGAPLLRLTVRPPLGAGAVRVIGKATVWPKPTGVLGRVMEPRSVTVTPREAEFIFGVGVLAVIVGEPGATPVMVTLALVVPPLMVTRLGTVAAPVLDERFTGRPPVGAGAERFKETFTFSPVPTVTV